jgi:putative ABC transport system substrate-binding protein
LRVNVIVPFGTSAIRAAKVVHATSSATEISIVFAAGNDPVADGIVASLNRPGGNITGITSIASELGSKRLGLLRELLPDIRTKRWPRLSEQFFRVDKWSLCRG